CRGQSLPEKDALPGFPPSPRALPFHNPHSSPSDNASRRSPQAPPGGPAASAVILAAETAPALTGWSGGAECEIDCSRLRSAVATPSAAETHTESSLRRAWHWPRSTFSGQECVSPAGFGSL